MATKTSPWLAEFVQQVPRPMEDSVVAARVVAFGITRRRRDGFVGLLHGFDAIS